MKNSGFRKILKVLGFGFAGIFALIGLVLTMAFFAVKFHLTNDPGVVDLNDRYFQDIKEKYGRGTENDTNTVDFDEARLLHNLSVLGNYYPANAYYIQNAYYQSHNLKEAQRMIEAVNLYMQENAEYHTEVNNFVEIRDPDQSKLKSKSVFEWMNIRVTGIKVPTAQQIEKNMKDSASIFYLGKSYENLLDFQTPNVQQERFKRLTSYNNHFYSYLYAALNMKQIKVQWEKSGFPIDDRPEILATLYNIGFDVSIPKKDPLVGGSGINIKGMRYTFGSVAYEFYYSGELYELFPFKNSRFDFTDV